MQLTKLEWVKRFANITTTPETDEKLRRIILSVSEQIESYCNRTFEETTYKIWLSGNGSTQINLPNWPVSNIYAVSQTTSNAAYASNSTGIYADISVDDASITLHVLTTVGTESSSTLTYALYPTLSDLATAIGGVSGWSATVISGYGTYASILLKRVKSTPALSPARIDFEVPTSFESVELVYDTNRAIQLRDGGVFTEGVNNIFVWYKAGYVLPNDAGTNGNLPNGLVLIVNQIVADLFNAATNNNSYKSESIGDHSWTLSDDFIKSAVELRGNQLTPYRRIDV